jgi:hypothetical protein
VGSSLILWAIGSSQPDSRINGKLVTGTEANKVRIFSQVTVDTHERFLFEFQFGFGSRNPQILYGLHFFLGKILKRLRIVVMCEALQKIIEKNMFSWLVLLL